ncbi:DUF565 domain-containing protein [Synechococcales cyanobacterium C]|uniref:DUF565 domain-containing protein n=1 Tax=Petrachloros mirabilis ULC683 TaxID=2781853 RepID=A0A8K1ZVW7_9CYAN|nr:DUF565 domain-containing protein [Petrachloros mirabilis]NCJ05116.1 DUF565 domain-containing protein [Petrachloros mirabilis ULC683]
MQNTRLNTLLTGLSNQLNQQLRNPWRRLSVVAISLLFGVYLGVAFSAISGQLAYLDISMSFISLLFTELISWLFYSDRWRLKRSIWGEALNALKIGLIYGLFLLGFMLGS